MLLHGNLDSGTVKGFDTRSVIFGSEPHRFWLIDCNLLLCLRPLIFLYNQGALSWPELPLSVVLHLLYWSPPLRFHFQGSTSQLSKLEDNHYPSLISDFLVKYKLSSIQETTDLSSFCPLSNPQEYLSTLWSSLRNIGQVHHEPFVGTF